MTKRVPSYLTLRGDIYYFQMRIPIACVSVNAEHTLLIRKSTKTGNRKEALKIARQWWFSVITENNVDAVLQIQHHSPKITLSNQGSVLKISDLVEMYVADLMTGPKPWTQKTKDKFRIQLELMTEMIGNPLAKNLNADLLTQQFGYKISSIPLNMNKQSIFFHSKQRKSIDEIIDITKKKKLRLISASTVWDYVSATRSFLRWSSKRNYIDSNLDIAFEKFRKPAKQEKIEVLPFTNMELQKIFHSEHFVKGLAILKKPERHWLPLIGLYSGARLGEIAQLRVSDIRQDDESKIWYISINNEENKKLKTLSSLRIIPIHDDLISLGFLKFCKQQKRKKQDQMFPRLVADELGHWGGAESKWFIRFINDCGVTKEKGTRKSFHSLRHTFINYEKQQGLNERVICEIVGHSLGASKTHTGYQKGFSLDRKHEELNKVKYAIDLSKIKEWR